MPARFDPEVPSKALIVVRFIRLIVQDLWRKIL
jgi:hypothetical protein